MEIIPPADTISLERQSSINQYDCMLHVKQKGESVPVSFDYLDGIKCTRQGDKIMSHKIIIALRPWTGFHYPVRTCKYKKTSYFCSDYTETDFGVGSDGEITETETSKPVLFQGNNAMFGLTQTYNLRVGVDYLKGDNSLEPVE